MSLQVDPRSRSKSPGRSREQSRSRDNRAPSPLPSPSRSRPRSRSPAVDLPQAAKYYGSDDEAEIDRQYKLLSERRLRDAEVQHSNVTNRTPARYDVNRSDSEDDSKPRGERSHRDDRYDHSDSGEDYTARSYRRPSSTVARNNRVEESDSDSMDDALAYGDAPGTHPSYARPDRYRYAQPSQVTAPRQPRYTDVQSDWAPVPECERPGFVPPSSHGESSAMPGAFPPASTYADQGTAAPVFPMPQYAHLSHQQPIPYTSSAGYGDYAPSANNAALPQSQYANPAPFQYAQLDHNIRYTSKSAPKQSYTATAQEQLDKPLDIPAYRYSREPQFVKIKPGKGSGNAPGNTRSSARPHSLSVSSANNPPASPLLEPYQGTYQSISPMPSPIINPSRDDDISDVEPLDGGTSNSETSRHKKHRSKPTSEKEPRHRSSKSKNKEPERDDRKDGKRHSRPSNSSSSVPAESMILISPTSGRKKVSFYDAGADAAAMQSALNHTRVDYKPIIQILPRLSSDEILLLRQEYKNIVRMHGKGINLAKHLRLKLGTSSFGKVCYATALGRWESEAYWANCYYQAGTSRRELLIESLMGRSNAAIREIKSCFRDSRYGDSLERCMRSELRADKFRTAVLLALEAGRQDEREPLDARFIRHDVQDLHRALVSREGGETAMIHIIVLRSDTHLREVLLSYEAAYGHSFARAMIAKSRNLVVSIFLPLLMAHIYPPLG